MEKSYNGIVIFGEMGSGKDTLGDKIKELKGNSKIYNMGVLCREMMKVANVNPKWKGQERYIGQTVADKLRELDVDIMCDYILALILGDSPINLSQKDDYIQTLIKNLESIKDSHLSIIVGGRTQTDFDYWKKLNFLMIGIKVGDSLREKRLESRDGALVAKNSSSNHNTELEVPYIINNLCDEIIVNDGTLEDLKSNTEKVLRKYNL